MDNLKEDFASLVAKTSISDGVDRRDFLKTALGTGFAAAVLPIAAHSAVTTDSKGLTVGEITVNVNGQAVPVYRAQPEGLSLIHI